MMGNGLIWRMAWNNLRKQWKQTLLTIGAGAIGAVLIAVTFVNHGSVQHSIQQAIDRQLGPVTWRLTPEEQGATYFTPEQVKLIVDAGATHGADYKVLPYLSSEATITKKKADGSTEAVLKSALAVSYPMESAAAFDPEGAKQWNHGIDENEVVLNEATASWLDVVPGDVVYLDFKEETRLLRVKSVVKEQGLAGFREGGAFSGTAMVAESLLRPFTGLPEGTYPAVLSGTNNPRLPENGMFLVGDVSYKVHALKSDMRSAGRKMNLTLIIGFISAVAIFSSMLFMRQVLVMIAESRREIYGVLKAIGLSGRQVTGMFAAEALLLSSLSTLIGCAAGIGIGKLFISLFYGAYRDELNRMAGKVIPIEPYISWGGALLLFATVYAFLGLISAISARKAGKTSALEALRGAEAGAGTSKRRSKLVKWALIGAGIYVTGLHFGMVFLFPPDLDNNAMLWIILSWLGACCSVLAGAIYLLGKLERPLVALLRRIGIPQLSMMLAVKYTRGGMGRIYTTSLLFSLIMMMLTMTVMVMNLISLAESVNRVPQTVLGSGGYAAYQSEAERDNIMRAAGRDSFIAEHVDGMVAVEPLMADLNIKPDSLAKAIVPMSETLLGGELPPLVERDPRFASDREAWEAILQDPELIMLPAKFMEDLQEEAVKGPVKAGDEISLPVYFGKQLRMENEPKEQVATLTMKIAGFLPDEAEEHLMDFYGATYVNASVAEELAPYGFKWFNQNQLGFVLFQFDYRDVALAQELEQRFAVGGVLGFTVPYLNNGAAELFKNRITLSFVGFVSFSGLISLMGLAVVQYRSVRERSKQIAMMRCIGVPGKQLYWLFVLEGLAISGIGLLAGWGVGTTGAHLFVGAAKRDMGAHEQELVLSYPFEIILPVLGGLLLLALLLNMAPAKAAIRLKAADALRMSND